MFLSTSSILQSNIINICILILILIKLVERFVNPTLNDRHKNISHQIQNTEQLLQQANANLTTAKNQESNVKKHLEQIQDNTETHIKNIRESALNQRKTEIKKIVQERKKQIQAERLSTKNQTYQKTATLLIEKSTHILKKILTYQKQLELINMNIEQLDNIK